MSQGKPDMQMCTGQAGLMVTSAIAGIEPDLPYAGNKAPGR